MHKYLQLIRTFFHLEEKQTKSMLVLTIVMNLLYCSLHSMISMFSSAMNQPIFYYLIQYGLYLMLSIIYYLLFTQFMRNRYQDQKKIQWKSFIFPLIKLETIIFIVMELLAFLSFYSSIEGLSLRYLWIVFALLMTIVYIPFRFYGYHQIYHQLKNPFIIIKNSMQVFVKHYMSLFYSFMIFAILYIGCYYVGIYLLELPMTFHLLSISSQVLTMLNPFMFLYQFMGGTQTFNILSFVLCVGFGILLSLAMVYYFSYLINIFDEEVQY